MVVVVGVGDSVDVVDVVVVDVVVAHLLLRDRPVFVVVVGGGSVVDVVVAHLLLVVPVVHRDRQVYELSNQTVRTPQISWALLPW